MRREDTPWVRRAGPKARALARKLRNRILTDCQPDDRLPSEEALAAQHRCSSTTVRAALALLAADGLILRRHGSGTYVSDRLPGTGGTIELIYSGTPQSLLRIDWARSAYEGVLSAATEAERHVSLILALSSPYRVQQDLLRRGDPSQVDSVICLEVFNAELLAGLAARVPTVSIDCACFQPGVSSCFLNHDQNMDAAVEHLYRLGHRRLALLGNMSPRNPDPAIPARSQAFRKALLARGMPFAVQWIHALVSAPQAVEFVRHWRQVSAGDRPTGAICVNNAWALAQAAVSMGVRIPQDLSLVAVGNEGPWAAWSQTVRGANVNRIDVQRELTGQPTDPMDPALTALRNMRICEAQLPFEDMGRWAVQEVLRRLKQPDAAPAHESFNCTIEPGNSVASPTGYSPQ